MSSSRTVIGMFVFLVLFFSAAGARGQQNHRLTRLARLVVDSAQLDKYNHFLKEEIETSMRVEPGVLMLYAVADKSNPARITILEIYADSTVYRSHLLTPHFLKYKTGTAGMVKQLELVPVIPLIPDMKIRL